MENHRPKPESNDNTTKQEREPTNEERWINDVNEEFQEDVPLVNEHEDTEESENDAEGEESNIAS